MVLTLACRHRGPNETGARGYCGETMQWRTDNRVRCLGFASVTSRPYCWCFGRLMSLGWKSSDLGKPLTPLGAVEVAIRTSEVDRYLFLRQRHHDSSPQRLLQCRAGPRKVQRGGRKQPIRVRRSFGRSEHLVLICESPPIALPDTGPAGPCRSAHIAVAGP